MSQPNPPFHGMTGFTPPPAPQHVKKRRTWPWVVLAVIGGLGGLATVVGVLGAAASSGHHHAHTVAAPATHTSAPTPPPAPATPNPDGTFRANSACDVDLSASLYGPNHLIGDVRLHNTGNIGTVVKVTIKWPQEGYGPIVMSKKVRTGVGSVVVVHFHKTVSEAQISRFQNVQLSTDGDPCKYNASMVSTFGSVQS